MWALLVLASSQGAYHISVDTTVQLQMELILVSVGFLVVYTTPQSQSLIHLKVWV